MKEFEKLVIKYFLIGIGVWLLNILIVYLQPYYFDAVNSLGINNFNFIYTRILWYLSNVIFGIFIIFDSIKYTKNRILISLVGFIMPVFGVCFLLLEKYLIQNITRNGK